MSDFHPCVTRIQKIERHQNADTLSIATVMDIYPVVIKTGEYNVGDLVSYIPYDAIVPDTEQFHFLAPQPKKDNAGNIVSPTPEVGSVPERYRTIKARKIRGQFSEGLIVPAPPGFKEGDSIIDYFGLTKRVYEEELSELPNKKNKGSNENEKGPKSFQLFKYDLEGFAKYAYAFNEGEEVIIQEKLDGENCCIIYAEGRLWVRSRNYFKRNGYSTKKHGKFLNRLWINITSFFKDLFEPKNKVALSHWWEVPIRLNLEEKLKAYPNLAIWGELYGNVSPLYYDTLIIDGKRQRKFRVFDIYNTKTKKFLEWSEVESLCLDIGLETVPILYKGSFKNDAKLLAMAATSVMTAPLNAPSLTNDNSDQLAASTIITPCSS